MFVCAAYIEIYMELFGGTPLFGKIIVISK